MFDDQADLGENKALYRLKEIFKYQNIAIYALTFLVSMLSIKGKVMPFGLAMIAACVGESIPLVGVIISAIAGTAVTNAASIGNMIIVLAVYLFLVLFINSKVAVEERNEEVKSGGKLFFAIFIIALIKNFIGVFSAYDIFINAISGGLTYVFYKIFVNGLAIIRDFKIKSVFTIEELIAGFIIISLASLAFSDVMIFSFSLSNIIILFLIMLIGWQKEISAGAAAGTSIGIAVCLAGGASLIQIPVFLAAGIWSGILKRFGKIGVIIGFILGNIVLKYCVKDETLITYIREIFIASVGLLVMPKGVKINIEEIFDKDKLIDNKGDNRLEEGKEEKKSQRLKTISNMFSDFMTNQENKEIAKTSIEEKLLSNLEEIKNNIFYEEISNKENGMVKDICTTLIKKELIVDKDLIEILKEHNNYVFMQDESIKNDLQEIVKIANRTFKSVQTGIYKPQDKKEKIGAFNDEIKSVKKEIDEYILDTDSKDQNKFIKQEKELIVLLKEKGIESAGCSIKQLKNQKHIIELKLDYNEKSLRDKTKIADIASLISKKIGEKIVFHKERIDEDRKEYVQIYSSEDQYVLQVGSSKIAKGGLEKSSDCSLQIKLSDGKYLLAIADGKGSGEKAREYSKLTLKLIKQLLVAGFNKEDAVKLIEAKAKLFKEAEKHSSIDATVLDLFVGKIDILKSGACTTYIKNKKDIKKIQSETMPLADIKGLSAQTETLDVEDGDILVMCSDGITDSRIDYGVWIEDLLKNVATNNVQKIADMILEEAIENNLGTAQDDMTVIVSKIVKRK